MNDLYLHYKGFKPATPEQMAEAKRRSIEESKAKAAEKEAERERRRVSEIEYRRKWDEYWRSLGVDNIIELPGTRNGESVVTRFEMGKDGRMTDLGDVPGKTAVDWLCRASRSLKIS